MSRRLSGNNEKSVCFPCQEPYTLYSRFISYSIQHDRKMSLVYAKCRKICKTFPSDQVDCHTFMNAPEESLFLVSFAS